jgi:hypothetical protein
LRNFLEEKISSYLSDIELTPSDPKVSKNVDDQFEVEIKAIYKGSPVNKIHARFDLPDNPNRTINNGSSSLFIYNEPSFISQKLTVLLSMFTDKKGDLADLEKDFNIDYKREITLDFSKVMSFDFTIDDKGEGLVCFQPDIKHLSISKVEWDFGDNIQSDEVNAKHIYKNLDTFLVKMKLNSSEEIMKTHRIRYDVSSKKFVMGDIPQKKVDIPKVVDIPKDVNKLPDTSHSTVISDLIKKSDFKDLITQLDIYKQSGKIIWGKENDFDTPENCFVFIIDPVTQKTIAVLEKGKKERKNLLDNTLCTDIKKTFTGKGAIFVEVY